MLKSRWVFGFVRMIADQRFLDRKGPLERLHRRCRLAGLDLERAERAVASGQILPNGMISG